MNTVYDKWEYYHEIHNYFIVVNEETGKVSYIPHPVIGHSHTYERYSTYHSTITIPAKDIANKNSEEINKILGDPPTDSEPTWTVTATDGKVDNGSKVVLDFTSTYPDKATSDQTQILQSELNRILGTNLAVDGWYGKKTEAAVKELQEELGIEQSGVFDNETLYQLGMYQINNPPKNNPTESFKDGLNLYKNVQVNDGIGSIGDSGGTDETELGSDAYIQQILKIAEEKGAREAFNQIMADVDNYGSQLDDFSSTNVANFNKLVSSLVNQIGSVDEEMHYFRNKLNRAPKTIDEMIKLNQGKTEDQQWKLLEPTKAGYHMNGKDGEYNLKFVSPDGYFEAVYNKAGVLLTATNDAENMGTYNYFGPDNVSAHTKYDVDPYIEWGNTKDAPSEGLYEHVKAAQNTARFLANIDAVKNYYVILEKVNPEVYKRSMERR